MHQTEGRTISIQNETRFLSKKTVSGISVGVVILMGCNSKFEQEIAMSNKRPNIVFILADDYGIMDSQAYGQKFTGVKPSKMFYETTHIDFLIYEGTAFSQAYANQLCSPTRSIIMTGKYAGRLGFTTAMPSRETYYTQNPTTPEGYFAHDILLHRDNILIEQALTNGTSNSAVPTDLKHHAGRDELSLAEVLRDYLSVFIGKCHIGGFRAKRLPT
ncbi:sulfatase-like protein [Flavobacteriaceae bacterium MAR_2009_75]|nr:sulfatase-like protein [Flavobacteriaceae bacterium MAR_2009_75]